MCRTGTATVTARRCPSHGNPVKVAERNARRRATYKLEKGLQSQPSSQKEGHRREDLNFEPLTQVRRKSMTVADSRRESELELGQLNGAQVAAVNSYTGKKFDSISVALYGEPRFLTNDEFADSEYAFRSMTANQFQDTVRDIDSAFLASDFQERTTYRGKMAIDIPHPSQGVDAYVDQNYPVGSEVVFDGYQSTSLDPEIAVRYAGSGEGLMFEMKTKSGLNVTSISEYDYEMEVLLPRHSRWKVVSVRKGVDYLYEKENSRFGIVQQESKKLTLVQMVEVNENGEELTERAAPPTLTEAQLTGKKDGS